MVHTEIHYLCPTPLILKVISMTNRCRRVILLLCFQNVAKPLMTVGPRMTQLRGTLRGNLHCLFSLSVTGRAGKCDVNLLE